MTWFFCLALHEKMLHSGMKIDQIALDRKNVRRNKVVSKSYSIFA